MEDLQKKEQIQIGINLLIKESKNELLTVINNQINKGLPITVMEMHLYSILQEVHSLAENTVEKEKQEFNQLKQKQLDEQKDNFVQE